MAREILRVGVDEDALQALRAQAEAERRPVHWQAEVVLRRALGLPFPQDTSAAPASTKHDGRAEAGDVAR
jgi:hypothetical protein